MKVSADRLLSAPGRQFQPDSHRDSRSIIMRNGP
jgi:hypothetical protein